MQRKGFAPWFAALTAAATIALAPAVGAQTKSCATCGTVESIRYVEEGGKSSGVGMIAGGVLGGVIGHQIGSGRGNTVATIAGAAGGAYAGNEIEKNRKKKGHYEVVVRLDNGNRQVVKSGSAPTVKERERVKIVDGNRLALINP
jgi:outer membrane lipoprotein SlyB